MKLRLSPTQSLALRLLRDPQIVKLLFGGGGGGAKSFLVCIWMVLECRNYPGIHIGLGREELKRLKQTTVVTLISKVHPLFGIKESDYVYHEQGGLVEYKNGSQIILIDMKFHPSDPLYDTFGSLELTHVVVEEVGEVKQKGVDVLNTRKNRFLNVEYGIVGKSVYTCNPTQNFIKERFYKIYKLLGMGRWRKWEIGKVQLPNGQMAIAFRAFIRSLVFDNPFASRNYIETLRSSPPAEQKRLLMGDWDVDDDDYMLFPSLTLDRALRSEIKAGRKFLGVDVSDGGKDNTYATVIEGDVATELIKIPLDPTSEVDVAEQLTLAIIKIAQQRGIAPRDVGIDGVGVGAGARVALSNRGWRVQIFKGGESATEDGYADLRSEQFWKTSQDMKQGKLGLYVELAELTELREELRPHLYTSDDKIIKVTPKRPGRGAGVGQSIGEKLGRSPDRADSLCIARWVMSGGSDSRGGASRVRF